MLTAPRNGWTEFSLDGTPTYHLSYLTDIPTEWLKQAIRGLETLQPFCVKGNTEPDRFLCVVSYRNCHIIVEDEDSPVLTEEETEHRIAHTSMLDFCQRLHNDLHADIDGWVVFYAFDDHECSDDPAAFQRKKESLCRRLDKLAALIEKQRGAFGRRRGFM